MGRGENGEPMFGGMKFPSGEDPRRPEAEETEERRQARHASWAMKQLSQPVVGIADPGAKEEALAEHVRKILGLVGEDPRRDGLSETPRRVARAYAELLSGYAQDPADVMKTFPAEGYDEMVLVRSIPFSSSCEHHMLPFTGLAHIGYIPNDKIVGLSKIPRLLNVFARRLQVQERLTRQVADALMYYLKPKGAVCVIEAEHTCMSLRGARVYSSETVTSCVRGVFRENLATRQEVFSLIGKGSA